MREWEETTIGELATLITKGTTPPKGKGFVNSGGVNYIKSDAIEYDGTIDKSKFVQIDSATHEKFKRSQIEEDDILFSMAGNYLGKSGIVSNDMLPANTNQALAIIRLDKKKVLPKYIGYCFRQPSMIHYVNNMSAQSAQPNINFQEIASLEINLPPLPQQKQIASILSTLDKKIALLKKQNQTLEELAQTLFKRWFVDFEFPNEQGKPYKSSGGKMIASELGEIPEGWSIGELSEVVEIGSSKRIFASEYLQEGIPFYRGKEVTELSRGNILNPEIYISKERYDFFKETSGVPKENDILLTSVGTIGNVYIVQKGEQFYFKDGNLTWFKKYKIHIDSTFIFEWLNSNGASSSIEEIKIGSTQQATIAALNSIEIVLPTKEVYLLLRDSLKSTLLKRQTISKEIQSLTQLRDTLLPKLMSGSLEILSACNAQADKSEKVSHV